jgi:4-amino-4-deoxy-L-arabinose transferase-like glycosyltransferase
LKRFHMIVLALIVLAYLIIASLFAVKTPAWEVPDEPAHYNYVRQVVTNGCCPVIEPGDWNNDYLNTIKADKFSAASLNGQLDTIQYEDHQPPLYYLLEAPIYAATNGSLIAMRLLSVLFGAGIIVVAWATVITIFPAQPWLALASAAFVAFLPQHIAMMAGVENDSLGELIVAVTLLLCTLYLAKTSRRIHPVWFGVLLGLACLTKVTAMAPVGIVVVLTLLIRARRDSWTISQLVRQIAWIAVPALLMAIPFWLRNLEVYGGLDFLAQAAHDRVVVGQLRTSDYIQQVGLSAWLGDAIHTSFDSFWGQFGWMGVPMTNPIYLALLALISISVVGAVIAVVRWRRVLTAFQRDALLLLGVTALLALAGLVYWNLKYVQFQGRYLYPGLIPIALFIAVGLAGWASLFRVRYIQWMSVVVMCLLALLDVYALFRIIIPALS